MRRVVHVWQASYPWEVRVGKINRALLSAGSNVMVLSRNSGEQLEHEILESGEYVHRVGGKARPLSVPVPGNPFWRSAIGGAVRDFKADLVIVRDIPLAPAAIAAAHAKKIPCVLDMAEHYPEAMRSWDKYKKNFFLRKLVHDWKVPDKVEAAVMKKIDGVFVVCEEQRQRLIREYGYPAEKICLVLNSTDLDRWRGLARGRGNADPHCFGYHGILCEDRQLDVVFRGFDLAAAKDPKITLLIAGGGESEAKLRAVRDTLKFKDRVTMTGRFKPEELAGLFAKTDYGIVSLEVNEFTKHTVANKFFDYAAMGKPFIHTDLAPLNSIHTGASMKFTGGSPESVADTMLAIKEADYDSMSKAGIAAIEREFNWGVDVKRMLEFLKQISA